MIFSCFIKRNNLTPLILFNWVVLSRLLHISSNLAESYFWIVLYILITFPFLFCNLLSLYRKIVCTLASAAVFVCTGVSEQPELPW